MDTQVANCSGDWRTQLQRQSIVNKIMDTLKRHLPFSGYERLQELKKIAEKVEQEIYTVATTQSEYTRKICYMMLTMETRLQKPRQLNSVALYNTVNPSVPLDMTTNGGDWIEEVYQKIKAMKDLYLLDSTTQTGNPNGKDVQEEMYQKIKVMKDLYLLDSTARTGNPIGEDVEEEMYQKISAMKDLYLLDLNNLHQKVISKLKQLHSHPQQLQNEIHEKLKVFKKMLERYIQFLQMPKHGLADYKDKLSSYERQISSIVNANKRKQGSGQQQPQA